ncbi:MAG: NADAR family protein [Cyanobacteria bacterium P01_A01_bin.83]
MEISSIISKKDLIDYLNLGNQVKYLYFWGHQQSKNNLVGKSSLSQWYEATFKLDNIEYKTAEHYMMAEKARLFNDQEILTQIISAFNPGEAKKLGRLVRGFDQEIWSQHRSQIVIRGNLAKFEQNEALGKFLVSTGKHILVEASPKDRIWGIGIDENNLDVANPYRWKGQNLLGFALVEVRNILRG